ncbi:MAG: Ferritin BfrB [Anaerolineae bacterium]|nr:Ferritin BfrB [Anaerolineae bacterium]
MTSLLKQPVVDAINGQVVEEFTASLQYTAIALYFDSETLPQLSGFFHLQAQEEHMHAMKLLNYITEAGGQPIVPATKPVKNHFESVEEAVALALNQELKVTEQINSLVSVAVRENDYLTQQFLQWFVTEQLEEVSSMSDLLNIVRRAGKDLFRIEDWLVQNPHEAAAGGAA